MALLRLVMGFPLSSFLGEGLNWQVGQDLLGHGLKSAFVTCL